MIKVIEIYYKYRKMYSASSKRPTKAATRNAEFLPSLFLLENRLKSAECRLMINLNEKILGELA